EAFKHVAANLVPAAAAAERSARTAGPARTERAATKPTRSARSACSSRRTRRTEGAIPESVAEAVGELARPIRPEEASRGLSVTDRCHRLRRRVDGKTRWQQDLRV